MILLTLYANGVPVTDTVELRGPWVPVSDGFQYVLEPVVLDVHRSSGSHVVVGHLRWFGDLLEPFPVTVNRLEAGDTVNVSGIVVHNRPAQP